MPIEFIVVKMQVINTLRYSDIMFVKYSCPLHRCAMQFLAC